MLPWSHWVDLLLHCQGNLFKGQGDPAHQAPKGSLAFTLCLTSQVWQASLWPTFLDSTLAREGEENLPQLDHSDSLRSSFVIFWLTGPGCESRGIWGEIMLNCPHCELHSVMTVVDAIFLGSVYNSYHWHSISFCWGISSQSASPCMLR